MRSFGSLQRSFCFSLACLFALAGFSSSAIAVDCGPYKVLSIQAQQGDVLVRLGGGVDIWKELGNWSEASTKPFLSVVMQALAMNHPVYIRYNDPYTCDATDYATQPLMVRLDATQ